MTTEKEKNGANSWVKVTMAIMGAVTLFTTGWAASSTTAWMDIKRIDTQGTQKTQSLETRMTKVETTLDVKIQGVESQLRQMNELLSRHVNGSARPNGGN